MGDFFRLFDNDSTGSREAKVSSFQVILIAIIVTEYWCRGINAWTANSPVNVVAIGVATFLGFFGIDRALRRPALAGLATCHLFVIANEFPASGNHAYLELLLCSCGALLSLEVEDERRLFLRFTRALFCIILVYAGIQKLFHGYYFDGQFLAFSLWIPTFHPVLAPTMPPEEFERVAAFTREVGDGPYIVDSAFFVLVSNFVCVAEILVVPLLLLRRTRALGILASLLLVGAIEAGARELFFGLVYSVMALAFAQRDLLSKAIPVYLAILAGLLLSKAGILPEATFY